MTFQIVTETRPTNNSMHGNTPNDKRALEREALRNVIAQWNANRLDLFELSEPNEDLEFHGVMRFYFQDGATGRAATKCVRVASDATARDVVATLVEKFRPDMRMLTPAGDAAQQYALYEIHGQGNSGSVRRLSPDEKPLLVQLNWHVDDREGRFLLRNINDENHVPSASLSESNSSFRRKLSKREKKQLKKQEKLSRLKSDGGADEGNENVADKLYSELPETSFTRSISNPEAVMRKRRQQILEKKLQQFRSKDGGPDTGGTLKIYGEALCPDVPYKTLLLSVRDCAAKVVKEMLNKYGLDETEDSTQWCLVQSTLSQAGAEPQEYVLDDDECPLAILMNHPSTSGSIMFHVRRRPADLAPRRRKKKPGSVGGGPGGHQGAGAIGGGHTHYPSHSHHHHHHSAEQQCPVLVELGADQATESARTVRLNSDVVEVGSANGIALQLYGPHIQPRHALISTADGLTTVTPCHVDAHTYVNGQRIHQNTVLQHGSIVKFGRVNSYRFLDPAQENRNRIHSTMDNASVYDRSPTQEHSTPGNAMPPTLEPRERAMSPVTVVEHSNSGGGAVPQAINSGSMGQIMSPLQQHRDNYETTFDLDGNVETVSTNSIKNEDTKSIGSDNRYGRGQDPILPAVLEFPEDQQDQCLARIVTLLDPNAPSFKLAPVYTLYLCARYRASTHYRPELQPTERAHKLTLLLRHIATLIQNVIQERYNDSTSQAFWLANSSELLHFLKSDRHISAFSLEAQETLAESVQLAFSHLTGCVTADLNPAINALLSETNDLNSVNPTVTNLSGTMSLLRHCRVNAALTIQLFSQLFHYISARALNVIFNTSALCCRRWGQRLSTRLAHISRWAESQGLELAAECHLAKIQQCAHLLQAPKYTAEDVANLPASCFKLNSVQFGAVLRQYHCEEGEPPLPPNLVAQAVCVARTLADELAMADGRDVRLLEQPSLALALLLPEDGYSCDVVRGVPPGLAEFIRPLQPPCRLAAQPTSAGSWTVYMHQHPQHALRSPSAMSNRSGSQQQSEIQVIKLHKSTSGMGLSIVAAKGAGQERLGIYIKSVVAGGAADTDGRLQAGDQLLKVDGQSLIGITQEKAAEYLVRTGPVVTLEVAKQGAFYHGLATLLQQPSPPMSRAGPRRMSERDIPSRFANSADTTSITDHHHQRPTIAASKSVPALHQVVPGDNATHAATTAAQQRPQGQQTQSHHDVFNPGYSRASSSNSINATGGAGAAVGQVKSRSVHNLVSPGGGAANQPQQQQQDQGFYQNLSVYRNSGNRDSSQLPPSGAANSQLSDRSSALRSSQNSLHSNNILNSQQQQRPASAYYSNSPLQQIISGSSSQQLQHPHHIPNQAATRPNMPQQQLHHHQSIPNLKTQQQNHSSPISSGYYHSANGDPQSLMKTSQSHSALNQQQINDGQHFRQHASMSALARGQAKIAEMTDEVVRRRQQQLQQGRNFMPNGSPGSYNQQLMMSPNSYLQQSNYNQQAGPLSPSSYSNTGYSSNIPSTYQQFSPTQQPADNRVPPKSLNLSHVNAPLSPRSADNYQQHTMLSAQNSDSSYNAGRDYHGNNRSYQQQQYGYNSSNSGYQQQQQQPTSPGYQQQYTNSSAYHKAPLSPPVAPKPYSNSAGPKRNPTGEESTPPLPPSSTHPLYTASMSEPPKGAFYTTPKESPTAKASPATNPWEREEREKEQEARRQQARQWRDRQIAELSALPTRTPKQEEQLRALKLERDFQRRAQESALDDEIETESTISTPYSPQPVSSTMVSSITPVSLVSTRVQQQSSNNNVNAAASEQSNSNAGQIPPPVPSTAPPATATSTPTGILKMSGPNSPSKRDAVQVAGNASSSNVAQNITNNLSALSLGNNVQNDSSGAPPPPERGSSYAVMSLRTGSSLRTETLTAGGPKRVSFNDNGNNGSSASAMQNSQQENSNAPSSNSTFVAEQLEAVREDPNKFISAAESMLASPTTPTDTLIAGATPGVIGAQEVYRDPRTRRLAEQQAQKQASGQEKIPEKLSFKEKMKMFAMETGEQDTPKDRSKISRAQRDIDNIGSPSTPVH